MNMPSDLDISRSSPRRPLEEVAADLGLAPHLLEPYGRDVAKVSLSALDELGERKRAKYVLVSAITPTPLGEGKTTTTVGLGQALRHLGKRSAVAIRQPSMGPTFGIKGGAAGGGYSQVVPMEALNLHLTGDMHAVTAANNMLAAMVDNHLHKGNALGLDPHRITWRRVIDINDRELRNVVTGLGGSADGTPHQTGFDITAASEVMAVLALSNSLHDMRERLGRVVVGYTYQGQPVTAEQLGAAGAMTVIMREAIKPNLMQTVENTPVLVHAGPFGNIAHGNSSIVADRIASRCADYVVTEAGFGADMGAERFFNIKCRASGLRPDAAVLVATVRALKAHSGRFRVVAGKDLPEDMLAENPEDVLAGADNLRKQIENLRLHGVSPVVAVNAFPTDHSSEHRAIREVAEEAGARVAVSTHFTDGGKGAVELAEAVGEAAEEPSRFELLYPDSADLRTKIETIATRVYGADGVSYEPAAARALRSYADNGFDSLPVCIAKTHLSLSSDPTLLGAPTGWTLPVREVRASVGAGFVYPICGDIRTMPGLSSRPAAEHIDIDERGEVVGLS
ncbi:formate--tetrahydrofolate ligase [Actinopolyspora erythraea]|uniref:Formate--tetrahydrofolate ligase n=1 Tax=Actinopolyspora erythraea TaxID=414996 RepID=A0A099D875_9ACTN|nr:formate--tetrahydrofolate ligase [Actinopolyspora erythraea]ASU78310.1 formate--tetrahydrofolate ligase [Actinopolyspora erythraea]KGI81997.1 formate--tetrahydrofolate ligase [Actinopolyspora erythraea]